MASILKVDTIQDQDGNNIINESGDTITIGASGDTITVPTGASLTVPNGGLSGQNYPAFEAYLGSNTTTTQDTATKMPINTEVFDTDGYYDNSVNYRFTPLVAGKYFVYISAFCFGNTTNDLESAIPIIYKNGTEYKYAQFRYTNNYAYSATPYVHGVVEMNGSTDYLEAYVLIDHADGGTPQLLSGTKSTSFGAYRIGA